MDKKTTGQRSAKYRSKLKENEQKFHLNQKLLSAEIKQAILGFWWKSKVKAGKALFSNTLEFAKVK